MTWRASDTTSAQTNGECFHRRGSSNCQLALPPFNAISLSDETEAGNGELPPILSRNEADSGGAEYLAQRRREAETQKQDRLGGQRMRHDSKPANTGLSNLIARPFSASPRLCGTHFQIGGK